MHRTLRLGLCAALFLMGSCSDPDSNEICGDTIATYTDPSSDFSSFQTFAVASSTDYPDELPSDLPSDTQTDLTAANNVARAELIALGLTEVDPASEEPDVYLFSLAATGTDVGYEWQCVPGYVWWGLWGWVWDGCAWLTEVPVTYATGTVVVGLADPLAERVVFGGAIQGVLTCESPITRIEDGVPKIFDNYPN